MLVVLDEFTRRCLAIVVARRPRSDDVLHCLADLFVTHGPPEHIRSDNVLRQEHWLSEGQQISIH
jgi:putative transposase